jgi:hypothetical protein
VSRRRVRAEVENFVRVRDVHAMRATLNENLSHLTGKSGALLQAQGIFIVVATYALDQGWPRALALSSLLLLIVSALAVMTNLRSVFIGLDPAETDAHAEIENVMRTAEIVGWRGGLFNIALYLTFLSVLLLGIGAIVFELNHA